MCINYVNEKLHKLYISAIFDAEKFELKTEGLEEKVSSLKYPDLTSLDVINLLDQKAQAAKGGAGGGKIGLFNIVNDFSNSTTVKKWEQLKDDFDKMHHSAAADAIYSKDKAKDKFKIRHSAKDVVYTVKTFIDRNKDNLSNSLSQVIIDKADTLVSRIF
jgi:myosin heavy subunit